MIDIDSPNVNLYEISYPLEDNTMCQMLLRKDKDVYIGIEHKRRNIYKYSPVKHKFHKKPKKGKHFHSYLKDTYEIIDIPPDCLVPLI